MSTNMRYRFMREGEETACSLIEKVFNEFVAPDYDEEGIEEFSSCPSLAWPGAPAGRVVIVVSGTRLAGVIEMLDCEHIACSS